MQVLGVDVGGSGIKGAIVDVGEGKLTSERHRIPTPSPATPKAVAKTVNELVKHFDWHGKMGCGFPAPFRQSVAQTAANIDKSWIGTNVAQLFSETTTCETTVVNDADAAGTAEFMFGAGRDRKGVVFVITVGTGFGTALFVDGKLVPNTELGHLQLNGQDAEQWASDAARKREDLSWKIWAKRFNTYLMELEKLFWPDLFIIGGGASKKSDKFVDRLTLKAELVPAQLLNEAGIIGAAVVAAQRTT
jgi:polyphosphate glucokinase